MKKFNILFICIMAILLVGNLIFAPMAFKPCEICSFAEEAPINPQDKEECLEQAQSYVDHCSMSLESLESQLEYHGYGKAPIIYAMQNVKIDTGYECAQAFVNYLGDHLKDFSEEDCYYRLITVEKFTEQDLENAMVILEEMTG